MFSLVAVVVEIRCAGEYLHKIFTGKARAFLWNDIPGPSFPWTSVELNRKTLNNTWYKWENTDWTKLHKAVLLSYLSHKPNCIERLFWKAYKLEGFSTLYPMKVHVHSLFSISGSQQAIPGYHWYVTLRFQAFLSTISELRLFSAYWCFVNYLIFIRWKY